jgi:hypothetical protein
MPCRIDLHVHTEYSDGSDSPEGILDLAASSHVQYLSFTDHDSMYWLNGNSEKHFNNASSMGITLIRGIELSTRYSQTGKKAHLLAYWPGDVPFKFRNVSQIVKSTQQMRNSVAFKQIEMLNARGYAIKYENVFNLTLDGQIFKHHILLELINLGYAKKMDGSFFIKYFGKKGELRIKKDYPDTIEVLHAIVEDGGISVLAHPGDNNIQDMIKPLKEEGLRGVECYHPSHSLVYCEEVRKIAVENQLFVTAGSDYHGKYYRSGILGKYCMSDMEISNLLMAFSL